MENDYRSCPFEQNCYTRKHVVRREVSGKSQRMPLSSYVGCVEGVGNVEIDKVRDTRSLWGPDVSTCTAGACGCLT